jgi:hypothetical protein
MESLTNILCSRHGSRNLLLSNLAETGAKVFGGICTIILAAPDPFDGGEVNVFV